MRPRPAQTGKEGPGREDDDVILEADWTLVISATVLVLLLVAFVVAVWLAHEYSLLRVTDVENDNEDAIVYFLAVLNLGGT